MLSETSVTVCMQIRLVFIVITAFMCGALAALLLLQRSGSLEPQAQTAGQALIGGPFKLTDHHGKTVTDQDFRGKFMLVFFGYTYCPDICPTELQVMATALNSLGAEGERITPAFVTVDPQRDTPEQLANYVQSFHPRLVGLTGSAEEIAAVAKAYRVYYAKADGGDTAADYLMDHSAFVYLMGPDGKYVTHFPYGVTADKMAAELSKQLASR